MSPGYLDTLHNLIRKWDHLGTREMRNGTILIGNTKYIHRDSFLHEIYPPLSATELHDLEGIVGKKFSGNLREFLLNHNGCNLFHNLTGIYGLKKAQSRNDPEVMLSVPYDIVIPNIEYKRLSPSKNGVVIKRYIDGSVIFSEPDGSVLRIEDSESRNTIYKWDSIGGYLLGEYRRIKNLFNADGYLMVDKVDAVRINN